MHKCWNDTQIQGENMYWPIILRNRGPRSIKFESTSLKKKSPLNKSLDFIFLNPDSTFRDPEELKFKGIYPHRPTDSLINTERWILVLVK